MISPSRLLAALSAAACLALAASAAPALAAAPAWQPVAASGPTNLPPVQSEVQRLGVNAEGGTYKLTATTAIGTGTLSFGSGFGIYGSGTTTIEVCFPTGVFAAGQGVEGQGIAPGTTITAPPVPTSNCAGFGLEGIVVTISVATTGATFGEPVTAHSKVVSGVSASVGSFAAGQKIAGTGIPAGTTIAAVGPGTLTLSAFPTEGGTPTLTASGTTAPIDFDAEASELEAALDAISLDVAVGGGPGGPNGGHAYFVAFGGGLADTDVAPFSVDESGLTGVSHSVSVLTTVPGGAGTTTVAIYAQNIGGQASSGTITLQATLPAGISLAGPPEIAETALSGEQHWSCTGVAGDHSFSCTRTEAVQPGSVSAPVDAPVKSEPGASDGAVEVHISGGGALPQSFSMPLKVSAEPAEAGVQTFTAGAYDDEGFSDTRAGGHPYSASTAIFLTTYRNAFGNVIPVGEPKDIEVDLPPGFLGNPVATPQCPEVALADPEHPDCSNDTIVGRATPQLIKFGNSPFSNAVFNVQAPLGHPGKFYFNVAGVPVNAVGSLRSDEDYGITVGSLNTAQIATVYGSFFTFWGAPADHSHDAQRCSTGFGSKPLCATPQESTAPRTAFLTSPVDCAREAVDPPITTLRLNLWQSPLVTHTSQVPIPAVEECENLEFEADFKFEPSDTKSDSPASFRSELTVPSEGLTDPDRLSTPEIRETVVRLPEGVTLNPSGSDGLEACTEAQIGYEGAGFPLPNTMRFDKTPQSCPEASKIGTAELKSALLEEPLQGALYLAAQGDGNPFGSLFALYLVIEDPRHGVFVKLPGEVEPDKRTGRFQVTFRDLPELPFTYLRLSLKGGNRSALASPTTCGTYVTTATNTPWSAPESGPPTVSANSFEINQGPNGLPCAPTPQDRPFNLALKAGTDSVAAGAHSPLTFQITRPDGSQELDTLELGTAPGLSATLKGIPRCTATNATIEAKTGRQEQAAPSCPAASQIGRLLTGAGAGPAPFYTSGKVYLAGPYKGAPLSVVAITPAVAGPFDLGNVVVRTALYIDRHSAVVSAKTDPIPQILEGVPLRIRDVRVVLDRDNFALNPTSCDPGSITARATGNSGAVASLSTRFQAGGCDKLAFGPKLRAHLTGGTKRGKHPAFTAEVEFPSGQANTKDVQVAIPHSEFLDQAHIRTICTRPQAAAHECPAGSIYGYAEAESPLLDGKLTGPVFLKSSDHQLPDLAIALRGPDSQPVEVEFQGRIDSVKGQIRNTIEGLPDVPVSKFVLRMEGGKKGLLVNSRNLCAAKVTKMTVDMVAHNNKTTESRPPLKRQCGGTGKARHKRHGRHSRRGRAG